MTPKELLELKHACDAIEIPSGSHIGFPREPV